MLWLEFPQYLQLGYEKQYQELLKQKNKHGVTKYEGPSGNYSSRNLPQYLTDFTRQGTRSLRRVV